MSSSRRSRVAAIVSAALATTWLVAIGGLLLWTVAPMALGWQPRLVLSGSMSPSLQPGDVVLTAPERSPQTLRTGQILAVEAPDLPSGSYLHRLVSRTSEGTLVTRGDANGSDDVPAVSPDRVLGRLQMVVPAVGYPALALQQGQPLPYLVVIVLSSASAWVLLTAPSRVGSRSIRQGIS